MAIALYYPQPHRLVGAGCIHFCLALRFSHQTLIQFCGGVNMPIPLMIQAVSDVQRATSPLEEVAPIAALELLTGRSVEACSDYNSSIVSSPYHPFVAAVHAAFNDHRSLTLSPDMLWLLIAQGFARHVNANTESMQKKFVSHTEKKMIKIQRDDFIKNDPNNPWPEVFSEFSAQIQGSIGAENYANIVTRFSTTGPVELAANEIVLMDAMQNYFSYEFHTLCGIPEVRLEGTVDDWQLLYDRTVALGRHYELGWWIDHLLPTLKRIAQNARGKTDADLWCDLYKLRSESGGPYITGWIVDFFPYIETSVYVHTETRTVEKDYSKIFANLDAYHKEPRDVQNKFMGEWRSEEQQLFAGLTTEYLPGSLSCAPFTWYYLDQKYKMALVAGFIGFTQEPDTLAVRPHIGWAVHEV